MWIKKTIWSRSGCVCDKTYIRWRYKRCFQVNWKEIFGKTVNKVAKTAAKKAATATGEYAGKKAGDKIVELLNNNKTATPSFAVESNISTPKELIDQEVNELTDQGVYDRVNRILSGGKLRRRNFI